MKILNTIKLKTFHCFFFLYGKSNFICYRAAKKYTAKYHIFSIIIYVISFYLEKPINVLDASRELLAQQFHK